MWRAVDAGGNVVGSARPSPAAALSAAPVVTWPMAVADDEGRRMIFAAAVGPGGERVAGLLDAPAVDVEGLARQTPAGTVGLSLATVDLAAGVEAAAGVDPVWLAEVERRRAAARDEVVGAGREEELEAALHVALLVLHERSGCGDGCMRPLVQPEREAMAGTDAGVDARIASGARLWLLAGAVASALGREPDHFAPWGRLVAAGWWPVGPSGGRLVLSAAG